MKLPVVSERNSDYEYSRTKLSISLNTIVVFLAMLFSSSNNELLIQEIAEMLIDKN